MKKLNMLLVIAMLAACRKDDVKQETPQGFIPSPNKKYLYEVADGNGSGHTLETMIINAKDSSGFKVFDVRSAYKDIYNNRDTTFVRSFTKDGATTLLQQVPNEILNYVKEIRDERGFYDISLTGFPLVQRFHNNPEVNTPMHFEGGPIKLSFKRNTGADVSDFSFTLRFIPGKMLGTENIHTAEGIFICTKWAYEYETHRVQKWEGHPNETLELKSFGKDTIWMKQGIGIVKSVEEEYSEEHELISRSTTLLKKIE